MASSFNSNFYFPQEGLNYLLNVFPRTTATASGTTWIGLFSTPWATISGYAVATDEPITLNSGTYPVTEVSGMTGYGRQSIAASGWSAPAFNTVTIGTSTGVPVQYTTTASGFTWTNTGTTFSGINGIFITLGSGTNTTSASGAVIWYAPFSDLSTVTLASGDSLTVTPTWQMASYPY